MKNFAAVIGLLALNASCICAQPVSTNFDAVVKQAFGTNQFKFAGANPQPLYWPDVHTSEYVAVSTPIIKGLILSGVVDTIGLEGLPSDKEVSELIQGLNARQAVLGKDIFRLSVTLNQDIIYTPLSSEQRLDALEQQLYAFQKNAAPTTADTWLKKSQWIRGQLITPHLLECFERLFISETEPLLLAPGIPYFRALSLLETPNKRSIQFFGLENGNGHEYVEGTARIMILSHLAIIQEVEKEIGVLDGLKTYYERALSAADKSKRGEALNMRLAVGNVVSFVQNSLVGLRMHAQVQILMTHQKMPATANPNSWPTVEDYEATFNAEMKENAVKRSKQWAQSYKKFMDQRKALGLPPARVLIIGGVGHKDSLVAAFKEIGVDLGVLKQPQLTPLPLK